MNILLLGNGFDLYHKLPTRYDNFLHTVDFLIKNYTPNMKTVADVFGNEKLQAEDKFIAECFTQHKKAYLMTSLDEEKIKEIIELSKDNIWFSYLLKTFDKQIGWIDFEREIAFVIDSFKEFFSVPSLEFNIINKFSNSGMRYVIALFDFFLLKTKQTIPGAVTHRVKNEYIIEYPFGSGNTILNQEKIITELAISLDKLSKTLKLYLQCFIENALEKCAAISNIDKTITFNYTESYEKFYCNNTTFHLHGNINNKIILGINSDSSDNLGTIDTAFSRFKKYFQRAQYETDQDYLIWLQEKFKKTEHYWLIVMGHSLDITDKDTIVELFRKMNEITILYHSDSAKISYIANLIKIFGKDEFQKFREEKHLQFISLNSDFTNFTKAQANNAEGEKLKRVSMLI